MLLRHLVTHFLQQQAKAKFAEAMGKGGAPNSKTPPHATPLFVDGLLLYPSDLDGGGILDLVKEKQVFHGEAFTEQVGLLGAHRVALIEVGEGAKANRTTATALQLIQPLWVISLGFASGLADNAKPGQIVMASRIINQRGDARSAGLKLSAGQSVPTGIHWGDLLTVDQLPKTTAEKKALAASGATAWDADSYFIAEAAAKSTLISVRIITEAVDDELPKAMKFYREQKSLAAKLGAATGALLDQPTSLQKMWKMRDDAIKFSDRLAKFIQGVVAQLPTRSPAHEKQSK